MSVRTHIRKIDLTAIITHVLDFKTVISLPQSEDSKNRALFYRNSGWLPQVINILILCASMITSLELFFDPKQDVQGSFSASMLWRKELFLPRKIPSFPYESSARFSGICDLRSPLKGIWSDFSFEEMFLQAQHRMFVLLLYFFFCQNACWTWRYLTVREIKNNK